MTRPLIKALHILIFNLLYIYFSGNPAEARVYAYIDTNMILHKPANGENHSTVASNATKSKKVSYLKKGQSISTDYDSIYAIIEPYALKNAIDPSLIMAIIKTESNFYRNSTSSKGAQGLMQLMPETARDLHVSDPFDPKQNIAGGTKYLRSLLDNYNGNLELSLAAYNAGQGNVKDQIPNIKETKQYVSAVIGHYKKYRTDRPWHN